ncbi:hypothetical protein [Cryobacterium sp. W22_MBD10_FK3]|uniref:hypothetical protein n=1 Tax=Cryobacterium sp. W22_MBD10_FK3 TaxID=3240273 RepID=UPI003F8E90D4
MTNRGTPRERLSWRAGSRRLFDKLPTPWLISGITAVLLAFSAVFGGLDDAPVQAAPVIEPGATHVGAELTVTVSEALLIDAFPEQLLVPEEGNRLLVVRAVVENTTTGPLRLAAGAADSLRVGRVPGVPGATPPYRILVIDDGSGEVAVQPGVPVELAFIWEVAGDAVAEGDSIQVQLLDRVKISEGELTYGGLYDDPVVTATLDLPLGDVGAGVSE